LLGSSESLKKNLTLLALGVSIGAGALYASRRMSARNSRNSKKHSATQDGHHLDSEIETHILDREDKFNEYKSSQLTNLLTKTAKKGKKAQQH